MISVKVPFDKFLNVIRSESDKNDYRFMIILVARYAEAEIIFDEIDKYWSSIHDITGKNIIFITSRNRGDELAKIDGGGYEICSSICKISGNVDSMINEKKIASWKELESRNFLYNPFDVSPFNENSDWRNFHTIGVSKMIKTLGVSNSDAPLIYIEDLHHFNDNIKIPVQVIKNRYRNLYAFIKYIRNAYDNEIEQEELFKQEIEDYTYKIKEIENKYVGLPHLNSKLKLSLEFLEKFKNESNNKSISNIIDNILDGLYSHKQLNSVLREHGTTLDSQLYFQVRSHATRVIELGSRVKDLNIYNVKKKEIDNELEKVMLEKPKYDVCRFTLKDIAENLNIRNLIDDE